MSRCFPYPPPGYTLSKAVEDSLIESIELQKERAKAREQRKERKKEKKLRSKDKRKGKKETSPKLEKYEISKVHNACSILENIEQLEKSGLTEEHEQPDCVGSTASDGAQNSSKRKRDSLPIEGIRSHCNVLRIRFKSKDASNLANCGSTSGRTEITVPNKDKTGSKTWKETFPTPSNDLNNLAEDFTIRTSKELICSTSGKTSGLAPERTGMPSAPDASMPTTIQEQELLLYRSLIENLTKPHVQDTFGGSDDLDWLLHGKNEGGQTEKRHKSENAYKSCSSSSSLQQLHARNIPEVDLYALPYTIPF